MNERRKLITKRMVSSLETDLHHAIAEVFDILINQQGWSLARLAIVAGVSRPTLYLWKQGKLVDPRYLGLAKLFYLADRSLDLLPVTSAAPALSREEIERLVEERVAAVLNRGLTLDIKEERIGKSFRDDPETLRRSVNDIKEKVFRRGEAKQVRKKVG